MKIKIIYQVLFFLLNKIFVPYRLKKIHKYFMRIKSSVASKLFLSLGNNVHLRPYIRLSYFGNISIGNNSSIGDRCQIVAADNVFIGNNVMMGPEVMIFTQNHEVTSKSKLLNNGGVEKKEVKIGNDVWIGARVIILPGAIINTGCVVAANAVVPAKEYEPYSIIGGNPAKKIKMRE